MLVLVVLLEASPMLVVGYGKLRQYSLLPLYPHYYSTTLTTIYNYTLLPPALLYYNTLTNTSLSPHTPVTTSLPHYYLTTLTNLLLLLLPHCFHYYLTNPSTTSLPPSITSLPLLLPHYPLLLPHYPFYYLTPPSITLLPLLLPDYPRYYLTATFAIYLTTLTTT